MSICCKISEEITILTKLIQETSQKTIKQSESKFTRDFVSTFEALLKSV